MMHAANAAPTEARPRIAKYPQECVRAHAAAGPWVAGGAMLLMLLAGGCPAPDKPVPQDTADYLGLKDGAAFDFENQGGDHLGETVTVRTSSILALDDNPDGVVYDLIAKKETGFSVDERTLTLEVLLKSVRVRQFFDCIQKCGIPDKPVDVAALPWKGGDSHETHVALALTDGGVDSTVNETHLFVVGDAASITVPAGDFDAFSLSWTKTDDAGSSTAILKFSENDGLVSWDGFDGAQLRRK